MEKGFTDFTEVQRAFSVQSSSFDSFEENNAILKWMRTQVHQHIMQFLRPGHHLLELNSGTGIDAVYFAQQGVKVWATDVADGMIEQITKKTKEENLSHFIKIKRCTFTDLSVIEQKDFDHIFSNFGGLNCTNQLEQVVNQFTLLLKPGGLATLVIMPAVCPWEMALALKGNFKTAFRRFKKKGTRSHLEGFYFNTFYYSANQVMGYFGNQFQRVSLKGLASISPPPYMENFPKRFPRFYKFLSKNDEKFCNYFPFNRWADHFILTMRKK